MPDNRVECRLLGAEQTLEVFVAQQLCFDLVGCGGDGGVAVDHFLVLLKPG